MINLKTRSTTQMARPDPTTLAELVMTRRSKWVGRPGNPDRLGQPNDPDKPDCPYLLVVPVKFVNLARHDPTQLDPSRSLARLGPTRSSSPLDLFASLGPFVSLGLSDQFVSFDWPKPARWLGRSGTSRSFGQLGPSWSLGRSNLSRSSG